MHFPLIASLPPPGHEESKRINYGEQPTSDRQERGRPGALASQDVPMGPQAYYRDHRGPLTLSRGHFRPCCYDYRGTPILIEKRYQ